MLFIEKENKKISIRRQCGLLGLNRSNIYYKTRVKDAVRQDNIRKAIDRQFLKEPCGVIKMMHYLRRVNWSGLSRPVYYSTPTREVNLHPMISHKFS